MANSITPEIEATILSRYLVKNRPSSTQLELYKKAALRIDTGDAKTLLAALRHPMLLPCLDAHDALFRSSSQLRQRLYLMFSILEASPDFTELFLPRKRSVWYVLAVAGYGIRGVFRLITGTILVKVRGL
jgi:hypothetical protein